MALTVTNAKREFKFKKNGTDITLPDPDSNMTPAEVLQHYSGQYPELTTATIDGPAMDGKIAVFNAKTSVGTKG